MLPRPTLQSHGCALLPTIFTPNQLAPLIPLADDTLRDPAARAGDRINLKPISDQ